MCSKRRISRCGWGAFFRSEGVVEVGVEVRGEVVEGRGEIEVERGQVGEGTDDATRRTGVEGRSVGRGLFWCAPVDIRFGAGAAVELDGDEEEGHVHAAAGEICCPSRLACVMCDCLWV